MSTTAPHNHQQPVDDIDTTISLLDPRIRTELMSFRRNWLICLAAVTLGIFAFLPIYWGTYYDQSALLNELKVGIIDLDSLACRAVGQVSALGPALTQITSAPAPSGTYQLGWESIDGSRFDLSSGTGRAASGIDVHAWAQQQVLDENYWAIIIANANSTLLAIASLKDVLSPSSASLASNYSGTGALSVYFAEARNFDTVDQFLIPGWIALSAQVMPIAGVNFAKQVSQRASGMTAAQWSAVSKKHLALVMSIPFAMTQINLRPFDEFAGIPATTIGLLYLLILTFFVTAAFNGTRAPLEHKLKLSHMMAMRIIVPCIGYFFVSLSVSLLGLAFGVKFDRFYGRAGFFIYWMMNWLTQVALGMLMESALSVFKQFAGLFLIFFAIFNVSIAFIDIADQNRFYHYAYITPVYQAVDAAKSIAFGTKNRLAQNFGIVIAIAVVCALLLCFVVSCQRKQWMRAQRRERAEKQQREAGEDEKRRVAAASGLDHLN